MLLDKTLEEIHCPNITSLHDARSDEEKIIIVHAELFKLLDVGMVYI